MAEFDLDLFVIGAGSGGVRAARIAAGYGATVAVAEEYRVGGTCVIRGCVPKKLMVYASSFAEAFEDAKGFGWTIEGARFDWATLIANKDREIARLEGIYATNLDKSGVTIHRSRAVVEGPNTVRLSSGETLTARYILIATGAAPFHDPGIPGAELMISSNEMFHLPQQPKRILIHGGGYIAVEFAGLMRGLGSEVHLVARADKVLRGFDEDLRDHLTQEYRNKNINLHMGESIARIERAGNAYAVTLGSGAVIEVDQVLAATGRKPNTAGLGLEKIGVSLDKNGAVLVDAASKSSVPSVYAVGDVTNRLALTPVAIREGHAFADSVFGSKPWVADHALVPTAVFSEPEMGTIGMTESQALENHYSTDIYKAVFRPMKHTLSGRETRQLMKIVVDRDTDKVLGVHLCGPDSAEMIQVLGIAVKMGATKADFDATMAVHPTAAEELVTLRSPTTRHEKR